MTERQLEVLELAATAIVNRFGAIKLDQITNKIHPELKGVRKTTLTKELKNFKSGNFTVSDDVLKISYFSKTYDRSETILSSREEYKKWDIICWEDIKEYENSHSFPLSKEGERFFEYCCKINPSLKEAKEIFTFRLTNYVNTHDFFFNSSLHKFILDPFRLPSSNLELMSLLEETLKSQTSWLRNGRTEKERIRVIWKEKARASIERLSDSQYENLINLSLSAVSFYGIITLRNFSKIIARYHKDWKLSKEELNNFFSCFSEESGLFYFDEYLACSELYNWSFDFWKDETLKLIDGEGFDGYNASKGDYTKVVSIDTNYILEYAILDLLQKQQGKQLLILSEKQLLRYCEKDYVKETSAFKAFEDFYVLNNKRYTKDLSKFRQIFKTYSNMVGDKVSGILTEFYKESGIYDKNNVDDNNLQQVLKLSQEAFNKAPRWRNNGFSSSEIKVLMK